MSHTPGPWNYEWVYTLLRYSRKQIGPWDDIDGNHPDDEDARLIAAAPDLLAELENAVIAMRCQCDEAYTKRGRHEPNSFCYLLPDFEKVIAKARGES